MAGKLGKYQMIGPTTFKGLVTENHLGALFQLQPQKASDLMVQLLAYHRGKTLNTFLSRFPVKEFENDEEYYWDEIMSSYKVICK